MMRAPWTVALLLSSSLSACGPARLGTSTTDPSVSRGVPSRSSHPAMRDEPRPARMPDPAVTDAVGLAEILAFADEHSPALAVARSTRARADALRVAASPRLYANPELTVSAGARIGANGVGVDADVGLWQQLQIAGERKLRIAAAKRFQHLTDAEIDRIRWEVRCDVQAAFYRALVERERAELATRVVAFQEEVFGVVQRQVKAGDAATLSLRLAEAEVAQARQARVAADQSYRVSRIRMAQLAGWPAGRAPRIAGDLVPPYRPATTEELVAIAKYELPSLRAREAALDEAQSRVAVARREIWPRPSIGLQYRREDNPAPERPYDVVLGGIALSIPSFQTNQGERAQARADVHVARAELDAATFMLDARIEEARSEVTAAAERVEAYGTEILPRLEENLVLLRRSLELGELDLVALLVARERFLRIQSDALGAYLDYSTAVAALERVVGVGVARHRSDEHEDRRPATRVDPLPP